MRLIRFIPSIPLIRSHPLFGGKIFLFLSTRFHSSVSLIDPKPTTANSNLKMDIDDDQTTIAKGTIVQIAGLASDAGKALNGGYGMIAKEPSLASGGNLRYPVLVYALQVEGCDQIMKTKADIKSIKAENLQFLPNQKQQLFKDAAKAQMQLAHESNDHPGALTWYEAFYERWPDGDGEIGVILTYVELLLHFTKEPQKALEAVLHVKETLTPSKHKDVYDQFLLMYVQICCAAGERIEEALEHALQIATDTERTKELAFRAFCEVLEYSSQQNEQDPTKENPAMFEVQLRAAKSIYELAPNDVDNLFNLGAAYCLKGDYLEGCKCYRRAMASGEGDPAKKAYREGNLIAAQLQCPGMPLEDYFILYDDGRVATCIKKADKDFCEIVCQRTGFGKQSGSLRVNGNDVDALFYPLPSSPDDPKVFERSFLDTLME